MGASKRTTAAAVALPAGVCKANSSTTSSSAGASPMSGEQRSCLTSQLRKTKICVYHLKGACQYGTNCAFAHSCTELQSIPDLRKTRLCQAFELGQCNSKDCSFAHGEEELRSTNLFYKKTLCIWNQKGKCRNGEQCRFAHGASELRTNHTSIASQGRAMEAAVVPQAPPNPTAGKVVEKQRKASPVKPVVVEPTGVKTLEEPMKVMPAACVDTMQLGMPEAAELDRSLPLGLPVPNQPFTAEEEMIPGLLESVAWWQWQLAYGMQVPPMLPSAAGASMEALKANLDQLRKDVANKANTKPQQEIEADLERLREDVVSLSQKCNEIQLQIQASDAMHPGAFLKTAYGLDAMNPGLVAAEMLGDGLQFQADWAGLAQ